MATGERSESFPVTLDPARHRDLEGRGGSDWLRRGAVLALTVIVALAVFDVFGQCSKTDVQRGASATLSVNAPSRLRGGLVFTSEIVITPSAALRNARVFLARGWFQGMSVNTIEPSPVAETSAGPWIILSFGSLHPGRSFHLWLSLQTNPTNVGAHDQDVALFDGPTPVATIHRNLFVFP